MPANLISIPVNPLLDDQGQFISLTNFSSMPIKPNPWKGADPGRSEYGKEYKLSFSTSSKLELAAIGGIETKLGTTTFIHDSIIYRLSRAAITGGSPIVRGTWWGYGIRVRITVKNMQLGVTAGWASLAASVQLGFADAEFEIESIGITDSGLFSMLPDPMDLNLTTFNEILKAGNAIRSRIHAADPQEINYQPLRIIVDEEYTNVDPLTDDRHLIFCYQQISNRQRLRDAKQEATSKSLDPKLVTKFYSDLQIFDENEKPSRELKDKAEEWLKV